MNNSTLSIIRAVLKIGGGYFVAKGLASDSELETVIAALTAVIGVVWGCVDRAGQLPASRDTSGVGGSKTIIAVMILALGFGGFGCMSASVPKLKFSVNPTTGEIKFENPKDMNVSNFVASVTTNGTRTISWSNLSSGMNPDVITTTGAAQAAMISGVANAVGSAVAAAAKTAVVTP